MGWLNHQPGIYFAAYFFVFRLQNTSPPNKKDHIVATSRSGKPTGMPPALQQLSLGFWRPKHFIGALGIQSPSENGSMEPKYLSKEVIIHPNHHLRRWLDP